MKVCEELGGKETPIRNDKTYSFLTKERFQVKIYLIDNEIELTWYYSRLIYYLPSQKIFLSFSPIKLTMTLVPS